MTLGGYRTTLSHPVSPPTAACPRQERLKMGITFGLMRVSVGIENPERPDRRFHPGSGGLQVAMRVTVKLHASLRNGRFEEGDLQVAELTPVRGLVQRLGIPADRLGILVVNGRHARLDDLLAPEDTVALFPPVGGG